METKVCPSCKRELPLDQFHKDSTRKDGRHVYCKECKNKWFRKYREENPEKMKEKDMYDLKRTQKYLEKLRLKVLYKLSNPPRCNNCGIEDIRVLTIDHINNDGAEERKTNTNSDIWRKIRDMTAEESKKEYQVLCRNCNWIKYLNQKT